MTAQLAYRPPLDAPVWRRRLLHSAPARIALTILLIVLLGFVLFLPFKVLGWVGPQAERLHGITAALLLYVVPSVAGYLLAARWLEARRPAELARGRRLLPEVAMGIACGIGYISACAGVLWLLGAYRVVDVHGDIPFAGTLFVTGVGAGVFEEIVFRGVLFRIVEEALGTWAALVVSALLFGFVHINNPGATVWSSVAIAIEAGLLLGMAYHVTRSLPLCMGIHAAWNFTQGSVYGSPVSGLPTKHSWLVPQFTGPDWLTGGPFGFEASVVAAGIGLAVSVALLVLAQRRGTIVPWRPHRADPAYDGMEAPAA